MARPLPGARALFGFLLGMALLTHGGHIYSPDGAVMYNMTRALLDGRLWYPVAGNETLPGYPVIPPETGEPANYSKYGLGMSLAAVPLHLLSRALLPLSTEADQGAFATPATLEGPIAWGGPPSTRPDERAYRRLWYSARRANFEYALGAWLYTWVSAFAAAGIAALVARIAHEELRASVRASLLTGLATVLGSPLWHYAREGWSEPLATLSLTWATERILSWRRTGSTGALAAAGLLLGGVALTKIALVLLFLPLGLLLRAGRPLRELPPTLGWIAAGGAAPALLWAAYNQARFGSPVATGYAEELSRWTTPWPEGLAGLLISPGRGLLIYCPLLAGALICLPTFRRQRPILALLGPMGLAILLALYSRWWAWEGGWCWGPRFLVPALPWLLLPLVSFFSGALSRWRARAVQLSLALAAVSSALSVSVNPHDYYQWMKRWMQPRPELWGGEHWFHALRWDWSYAPILTWWTFPTRETLLLAHAITRPGVVLGLLLAALILTLMSAIRLYRIISRSGAGSA